MRRPIMAGLAGLLLLGCGQAAPGTEQPLASADPIPSERVTSPSPTEVAVPPGSIVFDRYDAVFGAEGPYLGTFLISPDGTDARSFSIPASSFGMAPAWSPDGEQLVVNMWTEGDSGGHAGVARVDGSDFKKLEPDRVDGDFGCSDWHPDGGTVVCAMSGEDPDVDGIYTLRIDDAQVERLTTSPFHYTEGAAGGCGGGDGRAIYSPDGSRIAFIRQKCGMGANPSADESAAIEIMNADGSDLRELVQDGLVMSHPGSHISWSPDGELIAFGSQDGSLYTVDVESGDLDAVKVPREVGRHFACGPEWSPDGTRLVFSMFVDAEGTTDLYTMSPDGNDLVRITTEPGAEHWARWGPRLAN
jgi:Tol biopolymer transport system component